jgi:hypothetical protein
MDEMLKMVARARVMDELMAEGLDVALPVGTCDIDMLALVESQTAPCGLVSVPIQVVALHGDGLSRHLEATRMSGMLIALVWDVGRSAPIRSFAFSSAELILVKMIDLMSGADAERACVEAGPARAREAVLRKAIEPFAMSPGNWRKKLTAIVAGRPATQGR